jgi:phosphopantetheine--protein transferase-like protein
MKKFTGVGCDLEPVERFVRLLAKTSFRRRFFTEEENRLLAATSDPVTTLGIMFCTKEAVRKSLWNLLPLPLENIQVLLTDGKPDITVNDPRLPEPVTCTGKVQLVDDQIVVWVRSGSHAK